MPDDVTNFDEAKKRAGEFWRFKRTLHFSEDKK
jgi:hypothetical protein